MSVWDAFDESVQPQTTQMVSHFSGRELFRTEAEKRSPTEPKLAVGKTGGQQIERQKSMPQGLYVAVAEAQR